MTAKAMDRALRGEGWGRRFFTADYGRGWRTGWVFVAPGVSVPRGSESRASLRAAGQRDVMVKKAWLYRDSGSYRLNSYAKPALVLQTLEGLLGEETMVRVLRTYARRYRFAHPATADFVSVVNEVSGRDWGWFFQETLFSSELCDYAVEVQSEEVAEPAGWLEGPNGALALRPGEPADRGTVQRFESKVTLVRKGGVRMPVELRVEFADGRSADERWDGRERWKRFEYTGAKVVRATIDPRRTLAIDVDPANNEWLADVGPARRAAVRWGTRFLLWLQTLFELQAALG
jgi:hypothetical protein